MSRAALALAVLVMCGCGEKPKPTRLSIAGVLPLAHGSYGYGINWAAVEALIPTGCVIAGNAEGVPSGYVLRRSTHFYENSGPPDYWCNPKWKNKP